VAAAVTTGDHHEAAARALEAFRRTFVSGVRDRGVPGGRDQMVLFEGWRLHTGGDPRVTLAPGREPAAYLVQVRGLVEPAWRDRAAALGEVHGYLPVNTLVVDLTPSAAKHLAAEPFVQWIHPMLSEVKLQPLLVALAAADDPALPDILPVTLSVYRAADVDQVAAAVTDLGLPVTGTASGRRWGWLRVEVPRARITELAGLERVQWIEEYVAPTVANDRAATAPYLNAGVVWNTLGLTGRGQIVAHCDTGLDLGSLALLHPDFTGRVVAAYDRGRPGRWDDPHGHGTHTAGSIVGNGTMSTGLFKGIAWEASLVHQSVLDSGGGLGGLPNDLNELFAQAYADGARIHSDSWGASVNGFYTDSSRQVDEFMWDHPDMLIVFSAGNDGTDANGNGIVDGDSIGAPATAKSVLTVGAAESGRPAGSGGFSSSKWGQLWPFDYRVDPIKNDLVSAPSDGTNQGMAAFSSRGPTDDGRIKPEVVGPGTDIVSTRSRAVGAGSGWGGHPNSSYMFNGGTSMSTPLVAGAAVLVRQYFVERRDHPVPSGALLKAALMHGARSLAPGQYGTGMWREIAATVPDNAQGWGQVDLGGTLDPDDGTGWFFHDATNGLAAPGAAWETVFHAGTGTVVATLVYSDFPATAGSGLKLVNDLDLVLTGPDAVVRTVYAGGGDRTNVAEQIRFETAVAGVYTARVVAVNVPSGPQPFALIVGGPVVDEPRLDHIPLDNTFVTNQPYRVEASVIAAILTDTNAPQLFWRETSGPTNLALITMAPVSGSLFVAEIPAHPRGSEIAYYLETSSSVFHAFSPAEAPATQHLFRVTEPRSLTVSGFPANVFEVVPGYGGHTIAAGSTVVFSAPATVGISAGIRLALSGWIGTGSVPAAGATNEVAVVVAEDSTIQWNWVTQYALTHTSNPTGAVVHTSWWDAWSAASSLVAPDEWSSGGVTQRLAGWFIDGVRHPDATSASQNPAAGIPMFAPRTAEARYLPLALDADSNGLSDAWEQYYFGTNGIAAQADPDGDGFVNAVEFADRSNPRDPASTPLPPVIVHSPLANPQRIPAPWPVDAVVTDNHAVAAVSLHWSHNGGAWDSAAMTAGASNTYAAILPGPVTNGDTVVYRVEAVDAAGQTATQGPHTVTVAYGILRYAPTNFAPFRVAADSVTNVSLIISNVGLGELNWTLGVALFYDTVENGTGAWTHAGAQDVWHVQTARHASVSHAWHFGAGPLGWYPDGADASLATPPLVLGNDVELHFDHWARMEYDLDQGDDHYWDGAVVELSVDGGPFTAITPVGGYPHRITANPDSPFPANTPCYGETDGWEPAVFDLSPWSGSTVQIRFRFGSDLYVTEEGWYIDNVRMVSGDATILPWLSPMTEGDVDAMASVPVDLVISTFSTDPGSWHAGILVLDSDDPEQHATIPLPVSLHNTTRELWVTHTDHGTVTPSGLVRIEEGQSTSFWFNADTFFEPGSVFTNGDVVASFVRGATSFTLTNITTSGTVHIVFVDQLIDGRVPAWWLHEQGFTNASPEVEAATDHDGDAMVAWQEFVAVTDPHDPDSVAHQVLSAAPDGTAAVIIWTSYTNLTTRYDVHQASNLVDGFVVLATNLPATPPVNTYTNPGPVPPSLIYRILALPAAP
jgi:subtilisin family serine protease